MNVHNLAIQQHLGEKSGMASSTNCVKNYCPISLLSVVSKVLERLYILCMVMKSQLSDKSLDTIIPKLFVRSINLEVTNVVRCQAFLNSGISPTDCKCAHVTPIHKKGARNLASNYRPVSLTSIFGKLSESIIKDHILNHLSITYCLPISLALCQVDRVLLSSINANSLS